MKIFLILKKDLLILFRSRAEMAVLFLMPLAFIIPISFALGKGDGYGINRDNHMIALPVVNYDGGPRAQVLLSAAGESLELEFGYKAGQIKALGLDKDADCKLDSADARSGPACDEKVARAMLQRSARTAALIIPKDFSRMVDSGEPVKVTLLYEPGGDATRLQQIEGVLQGATIKMSLQNQVNGGLAQLNDLAVLAPENVRRSVQQGTSKPQPASSTPALSLEKVTPENYTQRVVPDTYQQTIPGYTVMYVFFIITSMTTSIRQERILGTFRRLLSAPVSRADMLSGKLAATMVIGFVQVLILFGVGALLFKLNLGNDPLAFLLLTLALVAAATAIGLAAATTRLGGGALAAPLVIGALVGGCMFPLDLMPPILRALSYIVPHSWALNGYQNLMVRGQGLAEVFPQILVLLGFALLFFLIAVRRFNFENQEAG